MRRPGTRRRHGARTTAGLIVGLVSVVGPVFLPPPASAGPDTCDNATPGGPDPGDLPVVQERLDYERVQDVATGEGITVAVVDSGLDQGPGAHPQTAAIEFANPTNVLPGYDPLDVRDCVDVGHGTGVSAIIAAPELPGVGFKGLAPGVTIMPIKSSDPDTPDLSSADVVAAGIEAAIDADVDVINLSLTSLVPTDLMEAAVKRAGRRDIVIVAASGNEGETDNRAGWPAEYAAEGEKFSHVLAVAAVDDEDQVASFSTSGPFVGVAAPGTAIRIPTPRGGYVPVDGTSFATPIVSATAALVRQQHPELTAAEVVTRIKATADRPGVRVPDPSIGYGIVNPYLAVTAVRDDSRLFPEEKTLPTVTAPDLPEPPDRTLQNIAYGVAAGLLGAAAIFAIASAAWRRTAAERRRTVLAGRHEGAG